MAINPAPHTVGLHSSKAVLNANWALVAAGVNPIVNPTIQPITGASGVVVSATDITVVNRVAPATTGITLPDASARNGRALQVLDYSTSVTDHTITLTPFTAAQKIMRQSTWPVSSNSVQLGSLTLVPIVDPDNSANYVWIIAP